MENYGEQHNEMIKTIMNQVTLSSDMTKEEKKEICTQGYAESFGETNIDLFRRGLTFNSPYEIIDAIKDKISSDFYATLEQDINYFLETENVEYENYFNERLSTIRLNEQELELYKNCSSILTSSVELWASEEGSRYMDLLYTPEAVERRPPTREQVVGMIGVHDWVGGVFGGILGGPFGVVVGAAAASTHAAISHSISYH